MSNFNVLDKLTEAGFHIIQITEGQFKDVEFSYGGIAIQEEGDEAILKFDYDIIKDNLGLSTTHNESFTQVIGKFLLSLLEEQTEKGEVVYYGGTNDIDVNKVK